MGWSCSGPASQTLDKWTAACRASTQTQNTFKVGGKSYFWELARVEHNDGAVTGAIWRMLEPVPGQDPDAFRCQRAGTFRINPDGTVRRAPTFLRMVALRQAA